MIVAVVAGAVAVVLEVALRTPDADPSPPAPAAGEAATLEPAPMAPAAGSDEGTNDRGSAPTEEAGEERAPAPCNGCLDELAAMDVAEALYSYNGKRPLDIHAELYADIPWITPDTRQKPWPDGLVDAPTDSRFGPHLPYLTGTRRDETWVVWFQGGWLSHAKIEEMIRSGRLPPVARAWPPLKLEAFVLVDARTGGIVGPSVHLRSRGALEAAADRARHWLSKADELTALQ